MKLAVIYHSETENTKQAAEWIADGMNEVSGVEARAFSIEKTPFFPSQEPKKIPEKHPY